MVWRKYLFYTIKSWYVYFPFLLPALLGGCTSLNKSDADSSTLSSMRDKLKESELLSFFRTKIWLSLSLDSDNGISTSILLASASSCSLRLSSDSSIWFKLIFWERANSKVSDLWKGLFYMLVYALRMGDELCFAISSECFEMHRINCWVVSGTVSILTYRAALMFETSWSVQDRLMLENEASWLTDRDELTGKSNWQSELSVIGIWISSTPSFKLNSVS